jgi:membrane-associated protease RseP (regulator of RpoE activity)
MNLVGPGPAGLAIIAALTALSAPVEKSGTFLGVAVQRAGPTLERQLELPPALGLLVGRVLEGSPADRAGIRPHDVLLELNGQRLFVPEQLAGLLRGLSAELPVSLELIRAREKLTLELRLVPGPATRPDRAPVRVTVVRAGGGSGGPAFADFIQTAAQNHPGSGEAGVPLTTYLGLRLGVVSPPVLVHLPPEPEGGAVILAVAPGSPAESAALEAHDVIVQLDRQPILSPTGFFEEVRKFRPQAPLLLTVVRQGRLLELPVRLGARPIGAPLEFDQTINVERRELPPLEFVTDADWLFVVKPRAAESLPTGESRTPTRPPTVLIEGAGMTIRLEGDPANRQATITDSHGSILYQGGITTLADRSQMPRHVWARVAELMDPSDLSPRVGPQLESDELWERPGSPEWL